MDVRALAKLLANQKKYEEAEEILRSLIEMIKTVSANNFNEDMFMAYCDLGALLRKANYYDEAERELLKAAELGEKLQKAFPFIELAELRIQQNRLDDAEAPLKRALEIRRSTLPEGHKTITETVEKLASLYDRMERGEEAEALRKQQ